MDERDGQPPLAELTAEIVSAYVSHNQIRPADVADLIGAVANTLAKVSSEEEEAEPPKPEPAVPVRRSVRDDYIVCLEDGKKLKMLKRYLRTRFNMSPAEYRQRWNLPETYPMVAPSYAKSRSELAQRIGLGRPKKGRTAVKRTKTPPKQPVK